jgi:hypothetical protein
MTETQIGKQIQILRDLLENQRLSKKTKMLEVLSNQEKLFNKIENLKLEMQGTKKKKKRVKEKKMIEEELQCSKESRKENLEMRENREILGIPEIIETIKKMKEEVMLEEKKEVLKDKNRIDKAIISKMMPGSKKTIKVAKKILKLRKKRKRNCWRKEKQRKSKGSKKKLKKKRNILKNFAIHLRMRMS